MAPDLVLGADGRRARHRARRERAGVARGAGRTRRRRPARPVTADDRRRSRPRRPLPDGRPAVRHHLRHLRPPGAGARRHERPGPGRRAHGPLRRRRRVAGDRPRGDGIGAAPVAAHPARSAGRRPVPRRDRARATASPSSTSSSRWPAATPAPAEPRKTVRDVAGLLRTHLPADDPFAPYADRLDDPLVAPPACAATSPAPSTRSCACPPTCRAATATSSSTTRRTASARSTSPSPCGTTGPTSTLAAMMDAHYPLQLLLYSAALHRYLRWRAARLRPGDAPRRRPVPLPARDGRPDHPDRRRRPVRRRVLAPAGRARRRPLRPAGGLMTTRRRPVRRDRPVARDRSARRPSSGR